jgi:hypothetical protein
VSSFATRFSAFCVVELEDLGAQRLDLGDLLPGLELELLLGGKLLAGATRITLPFLRMSSAFDCRMMSRA